MYIYIHSTVQSIYQFQILLSRGNWRAYQNLTISNNPQSSTATGLGVHGHTGNAVLSSASFSAQPQQGGRDSGYSTHNNYNSHYHRWWDRVGEPLHGHGGNSFTSSTSGTGAHSHDATYSHGHTISPSITFVPDSNKISTCNILLNNNSIYNNCSFSNDLFSYALSPAQLNLFNLNSTNNLQIQIPNTTRGSLQFTYFIQTFVRNI